MKYLYICVTILLLSCGTPSEKHQESMSLMDSVQVVHDVAMAEMSTLVKLQKELKQISVDTVDNALVTQKQQLLFQLEEAEKSMFDWMHQFNHDKQDSTYLIQQLISAKRMSEKIFLSIRNSKNFIQLHSK